MHFPTDINLLFDAIRKMITLTMRICCSVSISDWRQGNHHIRKAKRFYRRAQQLKRSSSKDEAKKAQREQLIIAAHNEYIDLAQCYVDKIRQTCLCLPTADIIAQLKIEEVKAYIFHAERQIDQIRRRVVHGESIAHHEKVFSLFEQHTEWISKGKAGVPVELGLKICIVKDQYGFILHHHVMRNETDDKIAVSLIKETQRRLPDFKHAVLTRDFTARTTRKNWQTCLTRLCFPERDGFRL